MPTSQQNKHAAKPPSGFPIAVICFVGYLTAESLLKAYFKSETYLRKLNTTELNVENTKRIQQNYERTDPSLSLLSEQAEKLLTSFIQENE